MRFGFAVKVLGAGGLKDSDARRYQSNPHLKVSIEYLHAIFEYLDKNDLRMYRMSSGLAPYVTHPDLPQFHKQFEEAKDELAELGAVARRMNLRLSLHPSQYIVLNAADEEIARKSIADLVAQADILDGMGLDANAVVITHVGGVYGDKATSMQRWVERYKALPEHARARLILENDDVSYTAREVLWIHEQCGVRIVFDNLHHLVNHEPDSGGIAELMRAALATWPENQTPKIHYSSPRTEAMDEPRKTGKAAKMSNYGAAPDLRLHADYVNPFEFAYFVDTVHAGRDFDVMIEAKAKDLAALKLRRDLSRYVVGGVDEGGDWLKLVEPAARPKPVADLPAVVPDEDGPVPL